MSTPKLNTGIFLENLDLLIPWHTSLQNISAFGNPEIVKVSEERTDVIWKNVLIFGNQKLDLTAIFFRTLIGVRKFEQIHSNLESLDAVEQLRKHLDIYLKVPHRKKIESEFEFYYEWHFSKTTIRLGQGDRFGKYYYLLIYK